MDRKRGDIRAFFKPKVPPPSASAAKETRRSVSTPEDPVLSQGAVRPGGSKQEEKIVNPGDWTGRKEPVAQQPAKPVQATDPGYERADDVANQPVQLSSHGDSPDRIPKTSSMSQGRGKGGRLRRIASSDDEDSSPRHSSCLRAGAPPPGSSLGKKVSPAVEVKRRPQNERGERREDAKSRSKSKDVKQKAVEVVDVDDFFSSSVDKAVEKVLTRPPQKPTQSLQTEEMDVDEEDEEQEEKAKERGEEEAKRSSCPGRLDRVASSPKGKRPANTTSQWTKLVRSMEPEQVRQKRKKMEARQSPEVLSNSEEEMHARPRRPRQKDDEEEEYVESSEEDEESEDDDADESEEEDTNGSLKAKGRSKSHKEVQNPPSTAIARSPTAPSPSSARSWQAQQQKPEAMPAPAQQSSTGKRMYTSNLEEGSEQTSTCSPSPNRKKRKVEESVVPLTKKDKEEGSTNPLAGSTSCFAGKTFVFTGVLDSMAREEAVSAVVGNGGRCTSAVSGRTDYLVAGALLEDGRDVTTGSKYRKALQLMHDGKGKQKTSLKILHEQEFLAMLPENAEKKPTLEARQLQEETSRLESAKTVKSDGSADEPDRQHSDENSGTLLWAEKYRPKRADDFVGNREHLRTLQTWLADWADVCLHGIKKKPPPRSSAPSFSPYGFAPTINLNARAALLSGPPGIGKTTAARLAAEAAGYDVLEYNASDARNKAHIEDIGNMTSGGLTLHSFLDQKNEASRGSPGRNAKRPMGACVLMDEVDGLSGGDRGGAQAIVKLIETSKCPIICICNDRMHPKVRTIASKCLDLRFHPPHMTALRSRVEKIAAAEDLSLDPQAVDYLCESAGGDLRQILTSLQMIAYETREKAKEKDWKSREEKADFSTGLKDEQVMHGPFECCKQLLDAHQSSKLSRRQKLDKFFSDYDLIPLLIQENYLEAFRQGMQRGSSPSAEKFSSPHTFSMTKKTSLSSASSRVGVSTQPNDCFVINLVASAACDLVEADIMNNVLRVSQQWGMLPDIGFLCCVSLPAKVEKAQGFLGRVQFPSWLGRNSTQTKHKRLLTELLLVLLNQLQCCSTSSGLKLSGYLDALYRKCVGPLVRLSKADPKIAVEAAMQAMAEYSLTRGMVVDNLNSLRLKNQERLYDSIETRVKSSFTRMCNAAAKASSAFIVEARKGRNAKAAAAEEERQDGEQDMEVTTTGEDNVDAADEDDDDPLRDSFILSAVKGKKEMKGAAGRSQRGGGPRSTPRGESNAARRGKKVRSKAAT
ncbi:ATPase, AAA family protein [Toxoplasma gondii VEG]|uniref:Replication factor C subunit 1 n=7 Tax=Toxoplasma gondii TaxID=5811 RepID=B9Q6N4_TOXGV|nr:ATPase, AAA family protein [Toxoplasma gondii VEG]RQX68440.1 ATPase, AAA family protein [Toxoplasma gondii CAST]CEL76844.1 TPA: replication factor C subunit, putative [Toxoplasma gondii VEG]